MTKIYEALENAGRDRDAVESGQVAVPSSPPRSAKTGRQKALDEKLLALYQRIESLVEGQSCRIVEFSGMQNSPDSSNLATALAELVATRLRKRVLLAAASGKSIGQMAPGAQAPGWDQAVEDGTDVSGRVYRVGDSSLFVTQLAAEHSSLPAMASSPNLAGIMDGLRDSFDLIIVDAPPLNSGSDAVLLSGAVDGVVLTIDAGKVRWQVVRNSMRQIEAQKGRVLGVMLNKQRYYIPNFIYRKLL